MKAKHITRVALVLILTLLVVLLASCDLGSHKQSQSSLKQPPRAPVSQSQTESESESLTGSEAQSSTLDNNKDYMQSSSTFIEESELQTESEIQTDSELQTESVNQTESENQTEAQTESEIQKESEAQTEEKTDELDKEEQVYTTVIEQTTINQTINQDITNNEITIQGTESSVAYATSKGLRSIVSVYCTFKTTVSSGSTWNPSTSEQTYSSAGSGVIYQLDINGNAFVITNYHVVYDVNSNTENKISDDIMLFLYGMEYIEYKIPATYVGGSMQYDLAILRVEDSEILKDALSRGAVAQASFADSTGIIVGQTAIAIGNPQAGGISATSGIVSVDSEYIDMTGADGKTPVSFRVIRVDTAINQGNSGGGLFNDKGEIIGIVNAKIISSDVENIGYAIPSNVARAITDNIIYYCFEQECESVMRIMLGISVTQAALYTEYDELTGILHKYEQIKVHSTTEGSLADGKLLPEDIIKSVTLRGKTTEITRQHYVIDTLLDARVGDLVTIVVKRANADGGYDEVSIELEVTQDCLTVFS